MATVPLLAKIPSSSGQHAVGSNVPGFQNLPFVFSCPPARGGAACVARRKSGSCSARADKSRQANAKADKLIKSGGTQHDIRSIATVAARSRSRDGRIDHARWNGTGEGAQGRHAARLFL